VASVEQGTAAAPLLQSSNVNTDVGPKWDMLGGSKEPNMLKMKKLVVAAGLCLVLFGGATANAEDEDQDLPQCYTLASLQGLYTIIGHYGAHLALALTRAHLDGKGNFTSTFVVNEPTPGSTTGARTLVTGSQTGTYTVNCDGTGVINRVVTLSNGGTGTVVSDFIIKRAVQSHSEHGLLIATEVEDAQRTPSFIVAGGVFLTRSYTRLPDGRDEERIHH